MDPARLLHRLGVVTLVAALAFLILAVGSLVLGDLFGRGPADHLVLFGAGAIASPVLYGIGTAIEVARDGRQAAGLRQAK